MQTLFHITSANEVAKAQAQGWYEPADFAREGFIHCSFQVQVVGTAGRYYRGRDDLVLLEIEPESVAGEVVIENLTGGDELFPHLYGRLPWTAVKRVHPFPSGDDGSFALPVTC